MAEHRREYPLFSLCGLNCGLCPRYHTDGGSRCPGCGGEGFSRQHPSCGVISCARRHGGVEYCFLCPEYPCKTINDAVHCDSFITHSRMRSDQDCARDAGLAAYRAELDEKVCLLRRLLEEYNDGRRKSFFCLAVNLLALADVREVVTRLDTETEPSASAKEKALAAVDLLESAAEKCDIKLKLRKKT